MYYFYLAEIKISIGDNSQTEEVSGVLFCDNQSHLESILDEQVKNEVYKRYFVSADILNIFIRTLSKL